MQPVAEMPCQELVEVITEYLEGTLPPVDRARFEAHLETCSLCRTYLAQMQETIRLLGQLEEDSISPETQQDLVQLFRNWRNA